MAKGKRWLACCLSAVFLFGNILFSSSGVNVGATDIAADAGTLLDFSKAGSGLTIEENAIEFLQTATGKTFTDAEKAYFEKCGITLKYNDDIPPESVLYSKIEDGFSVAAKEYAYTANNGTSVKWIPVAATVDGVKKELTGKDHTAIFQGLIEDVVYDIVVDYEAKLTVSGETLTSVLNVGFREGSEVVEAKAAYEAKLREYDGKIEEYEQAYRVYVQERARYTEYLRQFDAYKKSQEAYAEYLKKKEVYGQKYALWQKYLSDLENYERAMDEYEIKNAEYEHLLEEYTGNFAALSACLRSMEALESIFIRDSVGHVMYNTLKGDTVATVVDNQDKLVEYGGVNRKDVTNAGSATERLIAVLTPYAGLKTAEQKFVYYKTNYEEIKSQFILLYSSLNSLCQNGVVRSYLKKQGKLERYYQFISQLYVISTGLDDETSFSPDWQIRGNSVYDLLEECQIVKDTNDASPVGLTYPEGLDVPEKPEMPVAPEKVEQPQRDWVEDLTEPVAPEVVSEPKEPQRYAGERPVAPQFTAEQLALGDEVKTGALKEFKIGQDYTLTVSSKVVRKASFSNHVIVTFYDYDHKTVLYDVVIRIGETVKYNGKEPVRPSDRKYSYAFAGWLDENGKPAVFDAIEKSCCFYASYTQTPIMYTVTFHLHDETIVKSFGYGEMPSCEKPASYTVDGFEYSFSGWSPALSLVTENAEYTALYVKKAGSYTVRFDVRGVITEYSLTVGTVPVPPTVEQTIIEGEYFYEFTGWTPEIQTVTENALYTAVYKREQIAPFEGNEGAEVHESETLLTVDCPREGRVYAGKAAELALVRGKGLYIVYGDIGGLLFTGDALSKLKDALYVEMRKDSSGTLSVEFSDSEGKTVLPEGGIAAILVAEGIQTDGVELYRKTEEGEEKFSFKRAEQGLELHFSGSDLLILKIRRSIDFVCEGGGYVRSAQRNAVEGETVALSVSCEEGYRLKELYFERNGEKVYVIGDRFEMPGEAVTVHAVFEPIEYTVIFLDGEGRELSRAVYRYGEMPEIPLSPEGTTEGEISYIFSHWEPEVGTVTGDAVYRPIFKEGKKGDYDDTYVSPYDSDRFFVRLVLPALVVLVIVACTTVVCVVFYKKRKNKS